MSILDRVTKGPVAKKRKTLLCGPSGIGKTTWAAGWPAAIIVATEDGSQDLDVSRTPLLKTTKEVVAAIREVTESEYGTLVIDSIDWLEALIEKDLHTENFNQAFGQGTLEVGRRVAAVLALLDKAVEAGKHVVLIGHSHIRAITRPDGTSWSRYEPKLSKHASAKVTEWCDEVLFANTEVRTQNKQVGMKMVSVGTEGDRVLHTVGSATYQAKHRAAGLKASYKLSNVSDYLTDLN
jgi:hypothetical protein